jgi:GAF domain-containing protein
LAKHRLLIDIEDLSLKEPGKDSFLLDVAKCINQHFPHYNWVGFYFLEKDGKLHVGPYVGKPTPHTIIELDSGICGAAVSQGDTIVVDDVNADSRYLACSLETRSEIVIPIRVAGEIIGELDIDSDRPSAFGNDDKVILEQVVEIISSQLENQ